MQLDNQVDVDRGFVAVNVVANGAHQYWYLLLLETDENGLVLIKSSKILMLLVARLQIGRDE